MFQKKRVIFFLCLFFSQLVMTGCTRLMTPIASEENYFSGKLAFLSYRNGVLPDQNYAELYIMDYDGQNQKRLIEGSADFPSFSPAGSEIVCSRGEYNGDLFKIYLKDSAIVRLTFDHFGQYPIFSPDGSRIAFFHQHSLNIIDSDGNNLQVLTGYLSPVQAYFDFSPDGSKIAVESNDEIFLVDILLDTLINITNHPAHDKMPTFTPDGTQIAFISDRGGTDQIFLMNADGSDQTQLTDVDYKFFGILRFSPVGDKLVFSINRGGYSPEICTMNINGSDQKILAEGLNPRYTPDGRKIVYETYRAPEEGWIEIYEMNSDGSNQVNLTNSPATDTYPIVQPQWQVN